LSTALLCGSVHPVKECCDQLFVFAASRVVAAPKGLCLSVSDKLTDVACLPPRSYLNTAQKCALPTEQVVRRCGDRDVGEKSRPHIWQGKEQTRDLA